MLIESYLKIKWSLEYPLSFKYTFCPFLLQDRNLNIDTKDIYIYIYICLRCKYIQELI